MAHRKVQLYKYVLLDSGWRYCRAAFYENNRIKPHVVVTSQGETTHKGGQYYLGFARKWEPAGNDPAEAYRLLQKKRGELQVIANGGSVVEQLQAKVSGNRGRLTNKLPKHWKYHVGGCSPWRQD